ncbi:AprI/Inh family metalloprotease inhibitor [Brevundimonas subvibrioides]|uniref:AprI/Inh family metalloprotease inhibitor n=1 Tax=Brevundimonas subvibrioides TaxID=74313 RepID=UPI0032D59A28
MNRTSLLSMALCLPVALSAATSIQGGERPARFQIVQPVRHLDVEAVTGLWNLVPLTGDKTCTLALNGMFVEGGFGVFLERCSIAAMAGVRAWRPTTQGFELLTADASVALAFRRTGVDSFASTDGALRLTRAPST